MVGIYNGIHKLLEEKWQKKLIFLLPKLTFEYRIRSEVTGEKRSENMKGVVKPSDQTAGIIPALCARYADAHYCAKESQHSLVVNE